MPKFIGRTIAGANEISENVTAGYGDASHLVRLTYAQAIRLPASHVLCSMDTTDRGGRHSLAKRWYRWLAEPEAIISCVGSTPKMLANARARVRRSGRNVDAWAALVRERNLVEGPVLVPCTMHEDCLSCRALGIECARAAA